MPIPGPSLSDGMPTAPLYTPESGIPAPAQAPGPGILEIIGRMFGGGATAAPTPVAPANPLAAPDWRSPEYAERMKALAAPPIDFREIAQRSPVLSQLIAPAAVPGATTDTKPAEPSITWPSKRPPAPNSQEPVRIGSGRATPENVDPIKAYLPKMIGAESGGRMIPNQAGASSAFGPAQFTDGTWIDTVRESDPQMWQAMGGDRKAVLKLRENPEYHNKMAEAFTRGNAAELTRKGLPVNDASLYAMHFFGRRGGPKVLAAAPDTPIEKIVDAEAISVNPHLRGMTAQGARDWAAKTIGAKSGAAVGGDPFQTPGFVAPSLPAAPTIQALTGVDPAKFDAFRTERVMMAPPLSTGDRITNVLANMAAGASGAKTAADVLLGAGAGAGRGAVQNIAQERGELQRGAEKSSDLNRFFAEVGVRKAGAEAEGKNLQTDAANKTATLDFQVRTAQAKADADTKNAIEEAKSKLDRTRWEAMQEQAVPVSGGMLIARKTPDGKFEGVLQKFDDIYEEAKKIKAMSDVMPGGRDSDIVTAMRYSRLAKDRDDGGYKAAILDDFVEKGWWVNALPKETVAQIDNEAKKGAPLDPTKKEYTEYVNKKRVGLLWNTWAQKPELEKLIVPFMARQGHIGARMMLSPNG